jgi:hypothetical protein
MTRQAGWYWTPERVVAAIQVFEEIYGRRPCWTDFNPGKKNPVQLATFKRDGCWPSGATVIRHWGSWNYAMQAAGYEPIKPGTQPNPDKDKERCVRGHAFTPENTRYRTHRDGTRQRVCRACKKISRNAAYDKHHKGPGSRASRGMPPSDHPKWKEKV